MTIMRESEQLTKTGRAGRGHRRKAIVTFVSISTDWVFGPMVQMMEHMRLSIVMWGAREMRGVVEKGELVYGSA